MQESYAKAIRDASDLLTQAILDHEPELVTVVRTLDRLLLLLLREVCRGVFERILAAASQEVVQAAQREGLNLHRHKKIRVFGLFGPVTVDSPYLYDRQTGRSARPVKDRLGLCHQGRSLALERAMTDFGVEESYGQGAQRFEEHYGWSMNRATFHRVTTVRVQQAEQCLQTDLKAALSGLERPSPKLPIVAEMLVELDGSMVRTGVMERADGRETTPVRGLPRSRRKEDWREVRVGLSRPLRSPSEPKEPPTYVAQMAPYPQVVESLLGAAVSRGLSLESRTIAVADGGIGLKEELELQFPNLTFILDRPHLIGHLYETAEAIDLGDEDRRQWVHRQTCRIDAGRVVEVITELSRHRGRGGDRVRRLVGYLRRFRDCVQYNDCKARGFPIGSGEVESAHRTIPQKRLKLPGACWHPNSINPMLALRVIRANDRWQEFWN